MTPTPKPPPPPEPQPDPVDEVWGLIAFLIVAAFLGDASAAILAFAVLARRTRHGRREP